MTLEEIWADGREDMTSVAVRERDGVRVYVSLAHKSAQEAFDNAEARQGLTGVDRDAADWAVSKSP